MKKTLAALTALLAAILVGCGTGCSTPQQQQDACAYATTAYTLYLAYAAAQEAGGKPPSQDQILAAQGAAIILQQQCGWVQPKTQTGIKSARGDVLDKYGVPVIAPKR